LVIPTTNLIVFQMRLAMELKQTRSANLQCDLTSHSNLLLSVPFIPTPV
jgi:hypothetical protein